MDRSDIQAELDAITRIRTFLAGLFVGLAWGIPIGIMIYRWTH